MLVPKGITGWSGATGGKTLEKSLFTTFTCYLMMASLLKNFCLVSLHHLQVKHTVLPCQNAELVMALYLLHLFSSCHTRGLMCSHRCPARSCSSPAAAVAVPGLRTEAALQEKRQASMLQSRSVHNISLLSHIFVSFCGCIKTINKPKVYCYTHLDHL